MIWHFLEVWLLLIVVFGIGCVLGSLLYAALDRGRLSERQGELADAVGDSIDGLKARLGLSPAWRPGAGGGLARLRMPATQKYRPHPPPRAQPPVAEAEYLPPARSTAPGPVDDQLIDPVAGPGDGWDQERSEPSWDAEADWDGVRTLEAIRIDDEDEADEAPEVAEAPRRPARDSLPAMRPVGLASPRNGVPDDLQRIRGIGKKNEQFLNELGIFHFGQIAAWTPAEVRWVAARLKFPERIERDDWIGQATILATGGDTGYVKAEKRRRQQDDEVAGAFPDDQ